MNYNVVKQSTVDVKIKQKDLIIELHINVNDSFDVDDLLAGLEEAKGSIVTGYSVEKITNLNDKNIYKFNIIFDDNALSITQYPADLDVHIDGTRII